MLFRGKRGAWAFGVARPLAVSCVLRARRPEIHPSPVLLAQVMDVDTPKACAEPLGKNCLKNQLLILGICLKIGSNKAVDAPPNFTK